MSVAEMLLISCKGTKPNSRSDTLYFHLPRSVVLYHSKRIYSFEIAFYAQIALFQQR